MKVAIIMNGVAPLPAVRGGAVESLVEHILNKNETLERMDIVLFSIYDAEAESRSRSYKKTKFIYISPSLLFILLDKFIYWFAKDILRLKSTMKFSNALKRFNYTRIIGKYLERLEFDKLIFENHGMLYRALKVGENAKKYEGKYYLHMHNEMKSKYGSKELILKTKRFVGISRFICTRLEKFLGIEDRERFRVLFNCIDTQAFDKQLWVGKSHQLRAQYGIAENDVVGIFSGRLTEEKGIFVLLQALALVRKVTFKLLVVGGYFYDQRIASVQDKKLVEYLEGYKDHVIFTGYVPYSEIPGLYALADFAVLPSMWEEPAGLTVIEAMSSSLPIITTDSGGIPEYVHEEGTFILKRNKDLIRNLAKHMQLLIDSKELRETMGKRNRDKAVQYNLDAYFQNFLNTFEME